ncbi:hypothetical protein ACFPRL_34425 [Pseudoclavibacter helvolus]
MRNGRNSRVVRTPTRGRGVLRIPEQRLWSCRARVAGRSQGSGLAGTKHPARRGRCTL